MRPMLAIGSLLMLPLHAADPAPPVSVKPPEIDPHRIINESYGFLRDREPQMSEDDYQLYGRMVPMAATQPQLAINLLESMLADDKPESPAFEFALGNLCFANGRIELAETHFRNATRRFPEFLRAWINLGALYYSTERFEDAVTCLSRAIALGDRDAQTLALLAYSLYRTGDPLSAETLYLQAIALQPDNKEWISSAIQLLVENGEYARAEPLVRRMVRLEPGQVDNWKRYASILLSTERAAEAAGVLEVAVELGYADADMLRWLGDIHVNQKLHAPALAAYRRLAAMAPAEGTVSMLGAVQAMIAAGKLDEAGAALSGMTPHENEQTRVPLLLAQAQLAQAQARWGEARRLLVALLQIEPLHGEALMALGKIHREEGDESRAELMFSEAERLPEFAYGARIELARLALESGQLARGVETLESALALERTPELQEHLRRLRRLLTDQNESPP